MNLELTEQNIPVEEESAEEALPEEVPAQPDEPRLTGEAIDP